MRHRSSIPTVETLEARALLSGLAATPTIPPVTPPAPRVMLPAKKEDDKKKDKEKPKDKKQNDAPEITVLLNNAALTSGATGVDFGRVTAGASGATRTFT